MQESDWRFATDLVEGDLARLARQLLAGEQQAEQDPAPGTVVGQQGISSTEGTPAEEGAFMLEQVATLQPSLVQVGAQHEPEHPVACLQDAAKGSNIRASERWAILAESEVARKQVSLVLVQCFYS